ncbi:MAG TPA: sigma 54-interacting transcriptional regulator [Thermodesulfovibrionia bacterium]|nr:sigma 54-interacting transcriptional regulator [Thermodesulfovibrionia bacterium]
MFELLFISPDTQLTRILGDSLKAKGLQAACSSTGAQGLDDLVRQQPLIFLDTSITDMDSIELAIKIKAISPNSKIVYIIYPEEHNKVSTAFPSEDYEYLEKPFSLLAFHLLAEKIVKELQELISSRPFGHGHHDSFYCLYGTSLIAENLRQKVSELSESDEIVWLSGEKGAGKESVARAIHERSLFGNGQFVAINLSVVPQILHKAEIFGRENDRYNHGSMAQAKGGTFYIKEITRLNQEAQQRMVSETSNPGCRIMVSTESDPSESLQNCQFSPELFNVFFGKTSLFIPPLRQRRQDIATIAEAIIKTIAYETKAGPKGLSLKLQHFITHNDWQGNIKELEDTLRRAFLLSKGQDIEFEDLSVNQQYSLHEFIEDRLSAYMHNIKRLDNFNLYNTVVLEVERALILIALKETRGNQVQASKLLNINRNTMHKKIAELHINVEDFKQA